jgi:hypothetical protein
MPHVYAVGDVHGHYNRLVELLRWDTPLINENLSWIGGDATLCFVGDYFDRGPDGVSVIDLIMRLQNEAKLVGGKVVALLGNHDVWVVAAHKFGRNPTTALHKAFMRSWLRYGGRMSDLDRLTPTHIHWLCYSPTMALIADRLFVHADALFYAHYGNNIEQVNQAVTNVLLDDDATTFDILGENFTDRFAFTEYDWYGMQRENYQQRAVRFLKIFGGKQIIHGHTPIDRMTQQAPQDIMTPYIYAGGLCINIDGGIYKGGPGFIYALPQQI